MYIYIFHALCSCSFAIESISVDQRSFCMTEEWPSTGGSWAALLKSEEQMKSYGRMELSEVPSCVEYMKSPPDISFSQVAGHFSRQNLLWTLPDDEPSRLEWRGAVTAAKFGMRDDFREFGYTLSDLRESSRLQTYCGIVKHKTVSGVTANCEPRLTGLCLLYF